MNAMGEGVVIPLQTRSFYNAQVEEEGRQKVSCHTPPNEELLQRLEGYGEVGFSVVIPLQTRSFYNTHVSDPKDKQTGCHTPPNEELLQLVDMLCIFHIM